MSTIVLGSVLIGGSIAGVIGYFYCDYGYKGSWLDRKGKYEPSLATIGCILIGCNFGLIAGLSIALRKHMRK